MAKLLRDGRFFPDRRRANRAEKRLGVVSTTNEVIGISNKIKKVRDPRLDKLDEYFHGRQYKHLIDWVEAAAQDPYVPIRRRRPLVNYNLAKVLANRVSSKLVGKEVFPKIQVEDDPDTEQFLTLLVKISKAQAKLVESMRFMGVSGSVLCRFFFQGGVLKIENYNSKHCYPQFLPNGDLQFCKIQYVFTDLDDVDENGKPKQKWFRMDLGQFADILYDNPEYKENVEPAFQEIARADHGLGFVQGEWFRTTEDQHSPDGMSLIEDILEFIDELNYSLSQSSQAIGYNQDPQTIIKNMDEEELNQLVRSSQKAWNMGREGDASFLESNLGAVERAQENRDRMRVVIQDIVRVILLDPEKVVDHAQSGRAMEVLHGPMVELINELRPQVEDRITSLITKMAITTLILNQQGVPVPINIPPGYRPKSLSIQLNWPPIFPRTTQDLRDKISAVTMATNANLISRETGLRKIAKDFDVENVEEEIQRINTQPVFNPFGAF